MEGEERVIVRKDSVWYNERVNCLNNFATVNWLKR